MRLILMMNSMDKPVEITLHVPNIQELLRAPGARYRKRTLNRDTENFIVEESEMMSRRGGIKIIIRVTSSGTQYMDDIPSAVHQHFAYRRQQAQIKLKHTLHFGWMNLFIAFGLLGVVFSLIKLGTNFIADNQLMKIISESFIILAWVALWRPMELLLYDWYPIKRDIDLFRRLEESIVQVIVDEV